MDGMPAGETLTMTHILKDGESGEEAGAKVLTAEVVISGTAFPFYDVNFNLC